MANKICELCLSPDLGGLELYMMRASRYLSEHGECISVINEKGKLREQYEKSTLRFLTLKRRNTLLLWFSAHALADIIDQENIDVVHLHWTKDLPLAIMAKLISKRKPRVVQSRHMTMTRFKDDFYHRFLYKNLDMMLAVTRQVKTQIEKFIPEEIRPKVEVLYIGADQPAIISAEEKQFRREQLGLAQSFTVGIVGRIEAQKGQHLVLEALMKLTQKGIETKGLIVGHTMDEGYLQQLQKEYRDIAVFTGFTNEVQTLMQLCDVMVLATEKETFGLVLIEAMMCGVCVVASDNGGPLEIVDDGVNGVLFKTFDSDDLSVKLEILAHNTQKCMEFAKDGQHKAMEMFESQKQFALLQQTLLKV